MRRKWHPSRAIGAPASLLQRGFSMMEVLVAVLVLSIGLLGMAALMGMSVRNTQSANYRTQATNLAYDVIDMIRANRVNVGYYNTALSAFGDPAVICGAAEAAINYGTCGATHTCDIARWSRDLCATLPNGRGRIAVTPGAGADQLDISVDVCWTDDRSLDGTDDDCDGDSETLFNVTSGL